MKVEKVELFSKVGMISYIGGEIESLTQRHKSVDSEIQTLTKKLAELKETFLVLSGALQAMDHVKNHLSQNEAEPATQPPVSLLSEESPDIPPSHTAPPALSSDKPRPGAGSRK